MGSTEKIDTPRETVSTSYHGVTVTEEYRWLEDATSERTRAWTSAQSERTRSYLEGLPLYDAVRARVEEVVTSESVTWGGRSGGLRRGGATYFVVKREPPKQQPFLLALTDLEACSGSVVVVVDPNAIDESGATAIDWFAPSPDGRLVAVSLSSYGTEEGTFHVFGVESGKLADVTIPRVNGGTAGGSLAWAADAAFWYTRGPAPGERPAQELALFQEVWRHTVGESLDRDRCDQPEPLEDPKIAERRLDASPDGRWLMDRVERGDGGECQVFVRSQRGSDWWQVVGSSDRQVCRGGVRRRRAVPPVAGRSSAGPGAEAPPVRRGDGG
jgi:prolyl oligopeptidase